MYDFDHIPDRRASDSVKWNTYPEDVLPLWVADMDFPTPPVVRAALQERLSHGVFGYPGKPRKVQQAVAGWMSRRHGWEVDPQHVALLPGVVPGLHLAAQAFAQPGEAVLVQPPVYGRFFDVAREAHLQQQEAHLVQDANGRYGVDFEAFEAAITPQTRLFLLCNPQNPTGRVFTPAELERMAGICLRHGVLIVADEIHHDLVFPGHRHTPIASLSPEIAAHTITLVAPSKTFNIAGLQAAAAIIPDKALRERFLAARRGLVEWVNVMGQTAAIAAYEQGEAWLEAVLAYLKANRDHLIDYAQKSLPGIRVNAPEGTHLAWLDCRESGIAGPPHEFFLRQARVAINDGRWFGTGGEGFVRLNFATSRTTLEAALERMQAALHDMGSSTAQT
ncbi:MAG: PatB family C-S lyase [Anaerolineales bacterium]